MALATNQVQYLGLLATPYATHRTTLANAQLAEDQAVNLAAKERTYARADADWQRTTDRLAAKAAYGTPAMAQVGDIPAMNENLSGLLPDLHKAIDDDREGELPLGWRIALWSAMADAFGVEAQLRRNILAFVVAKDLMPIWNAGQVICDPGRHDLFFHYPATSLALGRQYLRGEVPIESVERQCERMSSDEDDATYEVTNSRMQFVYAAALQVLSRILKEDDEAYEDRGWFEMARDPNSRSEIREALFGEMLWCETHYWASRAAMFLEDNDIYDPTPETFARRRVFWHNWVRDSVPKALTPIEQCLTLLDEPRNQ